ncbi:unnamed protein product [Trifolium pratense]|uniref:Uncharacterized protein n=1 Tax=Trifolium pratense TaxID=57577 RepID=A0ACB0IMB4_TRIPR|nr:unnamed protein product [Trifolium pratense]
MMTKVEERLIIRLNRVPLGDIIFLTKIPGILLLYPNQRHKWIAEQTHAQREQKTEEVACEYAQEQEFYRQTALFSKKDKEKVELMQAVSLCMFVLLVTILKVLRL